MDLGSDVFRLCCWFLDFVWVLEGLFSTCGFGFGCAALCLGLKWCLSLLCVTLSIALMWAFVMLSLVIVFGTCRFGLLFIDLYLTLVLVRWYLLPFPCGLVLALGVCLR